MKTAFDKIAVGMEDAITFAQGDASRGRVHAPVDVKAIRVANGMSQAEFAAAFHLPIGTIREWEQNRRKPEAPARVLLALIAADAGAVKRIMSKVQ